MNVFDVVTRIEAIRDIAESGDYEAAHAEEDKLLVDVLQFIAEGKATGKNKTAAQLAAAAIRVTTLDFPRYCA